MNKETLLRFELVLTCTHPKWDEPVTHIDMLDAGSKSEVYHMIKLPNSLMCDLKNYGEATWYDDSHVKHVLELRTVN